jgi:hypothetical protein
MTARTLRLLISSVLLSSANSRVVNPRALLFSYVFFFLYVLLSTVSGTLIRICVSSLQRSAAVNGNAGRPEERMNWSLLIYKRAIWWSIYTSGKLSCLFCCLFCCLLRGLLRGLLCCLDVGLAVDSRSYQLRRFFNKLAILFWLILNF